jgi:hypothetical protein
MNLQMSRSADLFLLPAALLACCAGCVANRATRPPHTPTMSFAFNSVSDIVAGETGGTAVYLGDRRWITCGHVLEDASTVSIDGKTAAIRVLRAGEPLDKPEKDVAQALGDWVVFEAPEADILDVPPCDDPGLPFIPGQQVRRVSARYDPDRLLAPGQEVLLVGYRCTPGTLDRVLTVETSRVVSRPFWLPKGLLYLSGPTSDLAGLCGGAAVVVQDDEVVMVAIVYGACQTWWAEWPWRSLLLAVRPPQ